MITVHLLSSQELTGIDGRNLQNKALPKSFFFEKNILSTNQMVQGTWRRSWGPREDVSNEADRSFLLQNFKPFFTRQKKYV